MKKDVIRYSIRHSTGEVRGLVTIITTSKGTRVLEDLQTTMEHRQSHSIIDHRGLARAYSKIDLLLNGKRLSKKVWLRRKGRTLWAQHQKLGLSWAHEIHPKSNLSRYLPTAPSLFHRARRPFVWQSWEKKLLEYLAGFSPGVNVMRTEIESKLKLRVIDEPPPKVTLTYSSKRPVGKEKSVRIRSFDGKKLYGVWERPQKATSHPTVILIHGSGAETGDSGCGHEGRDFRYSPHQPFREVSRKLVARGYPVFRYDKRGIGRSGGNFLLATREDLLGDLLAVIEANAKRTKKPILLFGFSEGATLALSAARRSPYVRAIALAGGPAHSIDHLIIAKMAIKLRKIGWKKRAVDEKLNEYREVFDRIRTIDKLGKIRDVRLEYMGYPIAWWAEHFRYVPSKEAIKVRCPMLLLHGSEDAEVLIGECQILSRTLRKAKIRHEKVIFKGLNHFFTPACSKYPGFEYEIPVEIPDSFFDKFVEWADRLVA